MAASSVGTLEQRYVSKTQGKGGIWKEDSMASSGPCATITARYGVPCNIDSRWKNGISQTSPAVYDQGVSGKGNKWAQNWVRGISR
jgi:hypothetical protein